MNIATALLRASMSYLRIYIGKLPKLRLLIREYGMCLPVSRRRPAATTHVPDHGTHQWQLQSSITLPVEFLDRVAIAPGDTRTKANQLETRADHHAACLANATMWTNALTHRTVHDANGRERPEFSSFRSAENRRPRPALKPDKFIPGRTLNLYGAIAMAGGNLGHWMDDGLARHFLAEQAGLNENIDHVLVPPTFHDFHLESLAMIGYEESRVVELRPLDVLAFDELVCTTAPRGQQSSIHPEWSSRAFRRAAKLAETPAPTRCLYISRRDAGTRKFVNEASVIQALERRGFECIELSRFDFAGKIELFSSARMVVGLTGAGLVSAQFMPPGSRVLELFPPSFVNYNVASTCAGLGIDYDWLVVQDASALGKLNKYFGDLSIELATLERRLDELGIG